LHANFRSFDKISQSTAEIKLLPVFENGRPPYWNSISGFTFDLMYSHRHTILHLPAKFRSNRMIVGGVMTSYPFFKMAASSHIGLDGVMLDHPRSAIVGISSVLKFGLGPIYSFGDIAIFIFCRFGLKLPIHAHFFRGIFSQMTSPTVLTPKRHFLTRKHVVCAVFAQRSF